MKNLGSFSICGVLDLNLHSLNNEGGEGNQIMTRQVRILGEDGKLVHVNAISGDMFKHIQAEHLVDTAREKGLPLCSACKRFDPNRIANAKEFKEWLKKDFNDAQITDYLVENCTVDDLEGILVTAQNKNTPRKSTVEFGWIVGIPERVASDSHFHVKLVRDAGAAGNDEEGANVGQNIYHRPVNSGSYAVVLNVDIGRIGFNDITREYVIDDEGRRARFEGLVRSVLFTFLEPKGAMRNTQNVHIGSFSGVVTMSNSTVPAPTVSPLRKNYRDELESIVGTLNNITDGALEISSFDSLTDFTGLGQNLIQEYTPIRIT